MSQQLVLDLSTASARSKGQALRHNSKSTNQDSRRTRRKPIRKQRPPENDDGNGKFTSLIESASNNDPKEITSLGCREFLSPPDRDLVRHNPHFNTGSPASPVIPPTSSQSMFSVMSIGSKALDKRAYGQARRYLESKHPPSGPFPASIYSTDTLSPNPSVNLTGDLTQDFNTLGLEEPNNFPTQSVTASHIYTPLSKPLEQTKTAAVKTRDSHWDARLQQPPSLPSLPNYLELFKECLEPDTAAFNRLLSIERQFKEKTFDILVLVDWISRHLIPRLEVAEYRKLCFQYYRIECSFSNRKQTNEFADVQESLHLDNVLILVGELWKITFQIGLNSRLTMAFSRSSAHIKKSVRVAYHVNGHLFLRAAIQSLFRALPFSCQTAKI